jgi:hypothetical protein
MKEPHHTVAGLLEVRLDQFLGLFLNGRGTYFIGCKLNEKNGED